MTVCISRPNRNIRIVDQEEAHTHQLNFMSTTLNAMREVGALTDVTLVCEDGEFCAHKLVLCAGSPYFRAMFNSDFREERTGRVHFSTIQAETLRIILPFVYTGHIIDINDDTEALEKVLEASHLLQVSILANYCLHKLSNSLTLTYFKNIYYLADLYGDTEILDRVVAFIARNFCQLVDSYEFLRLDANQLKHVLLHPELKKSAADKVVISLFKWAELDECREEDLFGLFACADFRCASIHLLQNLINSSGILQRNRKLHKIFSSALASNVTENHSLYTDTKLLCFGKNSQHKHYMAVYNVDKRSWVITKPLPFCLDNGMAVAYYGGYVYLMGGGEPGSNSESATTVFKYSPYTNAVSRNSLRIAAYQPGAGGLCGWIYVVNGLNKQKRTVNTVQRFCVSSEVCEEVAPTLSGHNLPHVFSHSGSLVVVGSICDSDRNVESYDHVSGQWTMVTTIPPPIAWCHAAIRDNKLYVLRKEQEKKIGIYSFGLNKWECRHFLQSDNNPKKVCGLWSVHCKRSKSDVLLAKNESGGFHAYLIDCLVWEKIVEPLGYPWNWYQAVVVD